MTISRHLACVGSRGGVPPGEAPSGNFHQKASATRVLRSDVRAFVGRLPARGGTGLAGQHELGSRGEVPGGGPGHARWPEHRELATDRSARGTRGVSRAVRATPQMARGCSLVCLRDPARADRRCEHPVHAVAHVAAVHRRRQRRSPSRRSRGSGDDALRGDWLDRIRRAPAEASSQRADDRGHRRCPVGDCGTSCNRYSSAARTPAGFPSFRSLCCPSSPLSRA
jgi:hypothetical protein